MRKNEECSGIKPAPVRSPTTAIIPEGKKEDFLSLLDYFELTSFFYPSSPPPVVNTLSVVAKTSPPVGKSSSLDISNIIVVQTKTTKGHRVIVVKSENNIKFSRKGSECGHHFVACAPSLDCFGEGSFWKVTIDSIPSNCFFLGIIGNLRTNKNSYGNSTCYGWSSNSRVRKGPSSHHGKSGWTKFVRGECLYFHLKEKKLTMFSVQKKRVFTIDIATTFDAYIHFGFKGADRQWTFEPLEQAEYEAVTMTAQS